MSQREHNKTRNGFQAPTSFTTRVNVRTQLIDLNATNRQQSKNTSFTHTTENTVHKHRTERKRIPDIAEGPEGVFCHDVTDGTPERVEAVQLPVCLLTGKFRLAIGFDEGLGSCHAKWVRERQACCIVSS
jgi:hypothetical protein